ncbi:type IV pilus assembly protein PilY1 [Pseudomonas pohangensis]|uniref:Type IV pilus assembly protein PilY1 n=1 Tax=Pseudomonas pohangensis TaxID=364197 RepID=A0A1H2E3P7_9PSED|nr:PilC/PilY family type IV pilus protein [Pseudomonas pohangensis]SDT89639.1 type IV pilus assembly protein PilY1 [Pseudomonas pohangensis]
MRTTISSTLRTALLSCVTSTFIFGTSLSHADDTEIFFGGPSIESGVRPNVLFILDNSGSMKWSTEDQDPPNNSPKGEQQRMAVLKDSFTTIINQAGAINAGLMVLNEDDKLGGSRMVYPVTYLDDPASSSPLNTPLILESGDDATQVVGATSATIDSLTVAMGKFQKFVTSTKTYTLAANNAYLQKDNAACLLDENLASPRPNGSSCVSVNGPVISANNQTNSTSAGKALLYFSGLNIPAGSTVTSAILTVYSQNNGSTATTPNISVENTKLSIVPNDNNSIASRSFTATRALPTLPSWTQGRLDLNITQELNSLSTLAPITDDLDNVLIRYWNDIGYNRYICMQVGTGCDSTEIPTLTITYTSASPSVTDRTAALRFQNVAIPQGAIIESAQIGFSPAVANDKDVSFTIKAESATDSAIFTNTSSGAPSARGKLGITASWAPTISEWKVANPPAKVAGPDVRNLVQTLVDQPGWCGNNSMAFFIERESGDGSLKAFSIDGAPGSQPTLTVTYRNGSSSGCINPIFETVITNPNNDGYQDSSGDMNVTSTDMPLKPSRIAVRFESVPLNKGSTILDAQVIMTPSNNVTSTNVSAAIEFQKSDDAPALSTAKNNISGRTFYSGGNCTIDQWSAGTPFVCRQSQIKTGLQSVIGRSGWKPGNALLVSIAPGDSSLKTTAFEGNPAQSIKLRIKVANGGLADNTYTVRKHLDALVQSMSPNGGTPIVPTYYDASQYLSGNMPGFSSPITSACQPTHVVMLTDGQANGNGAQNNISSKAGSCSTALPVDPNDPNDVLAIVDSNSTDSDEACGRKLADFLARKDQSSAVPGDSYVFTHTIGFALAADKWAGPIAQKFLTEVAGNGKGGAYTADNATGLTKAFSDILQNVQDVDTTFVSASAPVNSFERQNNKDELYFSLFAPRKTQSWPGNLKRYRFSLTSEDTNGNVISNPRIVDRLDRDAVSSTGNFASNARSFWSDTNDGNDTSKGGAAEQLPAPASRKLFTYIGASPSSPSSLSTQPLTSSNTNITNTMLGAANQAERDQLFDYIRGTDPATSKDRKSIGDPIHSSPKLATYDCIKANATDSTKCDVDDQTAFIGTNEGFVQAFSTDTGKELFAFMPEELLPNIKKLKENKETAAISNPRPYGMDNPVTLWVNDVNKDGKIFDTSSTPQSGEFVYAYATMGRGGRGVYALDVTDRSSPKLLWYIRGGVTPGFDRLGQTWSAPVKTKIKIGSDITDVLIFAGGYNPNQDNVLVRTADTDTNGGNALYVVDANTGVLIWSASSAATTTKNRQMSNMLYSMPATPRVIDIQTAPSGTLIADNDKLADQIFIGDMGGQVWRFHINNGGSGVGLITPGGTGGNGIFATAIPSDYNSGTQLYKQQNLRRFYNEPDVALLNKDGKLSLSVNIGSGYRGHPLNKDAQDAFYSFRTSNLTDRTGTEGTITVSSMLDVTTNLKPSGSTQTTKLDLSDGRKTGGWFINLTSNLGEKVLTRALTAGAGNELFFSTYEPAKSSTANSSTCAPAFGTARGYAVNLFDGSPAYTSDPNNPKLDERFDVLQVPGIPPQPELICIGDQCFIIRGPGDIDEIEMPKLGKMYWMDRTEIKPAP